MEQEVQNRIKALLNEASQFNSTDLLVNIDESKLFVPFNERNEIVNVPFENTFFSQLYKQALKNHKETGVFPLCKVSGFIAWEIKGKQVLTPILLTPIRCNPNKIDCQFEVVEIKDDAFVNPYFVDTINKLFDKKGETQVLNTDNVFELLDQYGLNNVDANFQAYGNVHHHRYEIVKELEELLQHQPNDIVCQLLGQEESLNNYSIKLTDRKLFSVDPDQLKVFDVLEKENVVIQGPPGTGKSQVLVNLIAKLIHGNYSGIVVSDKRAALDVLKKKLNQFNLGNLCFVASSDTLSKDVIDELKAAWNNLEQFKRLETNGLAISENHLDQLQFQLDVLNQPGLLGGCSYADFLAYSNNKPWKKSIYYSDLPELKEWIKNKEIIKGLFENGLNYYLGNLSVGFLKQDLLAKSDSLFSGMLKDLKELQKTFPIVTLEDLSIAMKKAALCHAFNTPHFRRYRLLLEHESPQQKQFLKLRLQYLQEKKKGLILELEKNNWIKIPSISATEEMLQMNSNKSYIGKWRFKRLWSTFTHLPIQNANKILLKWKNCLLHQEKLSKIELNLSSLGIESLETDLDWVYQMMHQHSESDWNQWLTIEDEKRALYAEENAKLNSLYHTIKTHFRWDAHTNIELFLIGIIDNIPLLLTKIDQIKILNELCLRNLKNFTNFDEMDCAVIKSSFTKFTAQYPQFDNFNSNSIYAKAELILSEQQNEAIDFGRLVLNNYHHKITFYQGLLRATPAKLSTEQRLLRQRLKKGKSILVKEFSKSRHFLSLRDLFNSEAKEWIQLLKPIWLSNPSQVAKCFPLESGLFDVAIFDEASQIPLRNALGTIHRAKRILVAGDQQQMGPGGYFQSFSGDTLDLLHQASYHWKNIHLTHHYRSENPLLIKFSNQYFYENKLIAFPSFYQDSEPITLHYCEDSVYDNRINVLEAKNVAKAIGLRLNQQESIGVVAFSEAQLSEIYNQLAEKDKLLLEKRVDEESAFFKSLENVQGDECDRLIISLGYAKNKEGEFHLRFGPLNTKNGSKRLNVLLTRARKKIDFYASVKSAEFKVTSNEAVDLLRLFLTQMESNSEQQNYTFPLNLDVKIDKDVLTITHIYQNLPNARQLVTAIGVLKSRGWKIRLI